MAWVPPPFRFLHAPMDAVVLILDLLYEHWKTTRMASTDLCSCGALFLPLAFCV
jgi:hypothetical protein